MLADVAAERAVLAGTAKSSDAFLDVDFLLQTNTFTDDTNQVLWSCIKGIRADNLNAIIDWPLLKSKANELNLGDLFNDPNEAAYVKKLLNFSVEPTNVRLFAGIIRKLEIARLLDDQLEGAQDEIRKVKGNESIDTILALAQNRLFDFGNLLMDNTEQGVVHISKGADEYFDFICDPANIRDIIGISTGMPCWDAILGGLRRRAVNIVGARTGIGKSMLADNIALHVAGKTNIPVLYLDTEMSQDGHWHRMWANRSGVPSKEIETGRFSLNDYKRNLVKKGKDEVNKMPYFYVDIAGKPFEETLAFIRRWLIKEVGYDENGKIKDCLIIYDYLKMMSGSGLSAEMKEFQILGFQMTGLHNFAVKFDVPILSFVQLNRDGIDKESTDTVSQSDRIVWLASSLSIYKPKSDDEMASSANEGNRKMIVVKNRFGPVNAYGEYINVKADGTVARIIEGRLSSEVPQPLPKKKEGKEFPKEDDDDAIEFNGRKKKISIVRS